MKYRVKHAVIVVDGKSHDKDVLVEEAELGEHVAWFVDLDAVEAVPEDPAPKKPAPTSAE